MKCDESAEDISALCDGETIPREASEHLRACTSCQERLKEYIEMGAQLRLVASLALEQSVSPRVWSSPQNAFSTWWQKGWKTMRIPRLAFAILIAAIIGLGSTLAVVQVRAHSDGTVVVLKIALPQGEPIACPLSTLDKKQATCSFIGGIHGKTIGFQIDLVKREGNRVELAVRTKTFDPSSSSFLLSDIRSQAPNQVSFEPGQTLKIDTADMGTVTVTGEWFDHMPSFLALGKNHELDPSPEELRFVSPLLLSEKRVLGDFEGGSAIIDKAGEAVELYLPGEGRFILSLAPMHGAVQGKASLNRISFEDNGRPYTFLTGSPVTRGEQLWIVHEANFTPIGLDREHSFLSTGDLNKILPHATIPTRSPKK